MRLEITPGIEGRENDVIFFTHGSMLEAIIVACRRECVLRHRSGGFSMMKLLHNIELGMAPDGGLRTHEIVLWEARFTNLENLSFGYSEHFPQGSMGIKFSEGEPQLFDSTEWYPVPIESVGIL